MSSILTPGTNGVFFQWQEAGLSTRQRRFDSGTPYPTRSSLTGEHVPRAHGGLGSNPRVSTTGETALVPDHDHPGWTVANPESAQDDRQLQTPQYIREEKLASAAPGSSNGRAPVLQTGDGGSIPSPGTMGQ